MAYQRPQAPQGNASKAAPAKAAAPASTGGKAASKQSAPAKAAAAKQTTANEPKKGKRPDFEIIEVDGEGQIVKVEKEIDGEVKLVSNRLGAIWKSKFEDGVQMVKMADGTSAKIFPVTSREQQS